MVKIEITCKDGYAAKEYTRDDGTLAYFLKGPNAVSNDQGEVGRYDIRGKFAGKFKTAVGARKRFGVLDGNKAKDYAKITITTPDGVHIFIGDLDEGQMSVQERITLGMCLNNATELIAAQCDKDNQPQNMVAKIFDLTDELYAEYNNRYMD
jgi:hypothetical protein